MSALADLYAVASVALASEALAEIRDRLLDVLKVPSQLCRVHIEPMPGRTDQLRASLQQTDAGADLLAALRAGHVDRLVVEKALAHPDLSNVSQRGDDAESPGRETDPAVKPEARS